MKKRFQKENFDAVQKLLKELDCKAKAFYATNAETWYGDLGYVREELEHINNFLTTKP